MPTTNHLYSTRTLIDETFASSKTQGMNTFSAAVLALPLAGASLRLWAVSAVKLCHSCQSGAVVTSSVTAMSILVVTVVCHRLCRSCLTHLCVTGSVGRRPGCGGWMSLEKQPIKGSKKQILCQCHVQRSGHVLRREVWGCAFRCLTPGANRKQAYLATKGS